MTTPPFEGNRLANAAHSFCRGRQYSPSRRQLMMGKGGQERNAIMGQDFLSTPPSGCAEAGKNHQMTAFASSDNYPSEQELIDVAVAGDATGFNGIVSRYSNRIYRFILKNLGNTAIAEDLTQ